MRSALLLSLLAATPAAGQSYDPLLVQEDPTAAIGLDQRLGERLPRDVVLRDEAGREVQVGELLGERPVVLALVYYECPMLCTLVFDGVLRGLRPLALEPGRDFELIAVSIDPREGPELAAAKKERLLEEYGRPETAAGWHLLTGEEDEIRRLAEAVGFRYVYDEEADQYAHAAGLMVATPDGVLSRYLYGVDYAPRDLRLALVEAGEGKVGSLVDQVLMLCMHWDPTKGRYGFAIVRALQIAGGLTVLAIGLYVTRALCRERASQRIETSGRAAGAGGGQQR
jgi:protein SCO1/2